MSEWILVTREGRGAGGGGRRRREHRRAATASLINDSSNVQTQRLKFQNNTSSKSNNNRIQRNSNVTNANVYNINVNSTINSVSVQLTSNNMPDVQSALNSDNSVIEKATGVAGASVYVLGEDRTNTRSVNDCAGEASCVAGSASMRHVSARVSTFWNSPPEVKGQMKQLAAAGFFYAGRGDVLRCAFCNGELHKVKVGRQPMNDHAVFFPRCPFVRRRLGGGATADDLTSSMTSSSDCSSKTSSNETIDKIGRSSRRTAENLDTLSQNEILNVHSLIQHLKEENDKLRSERTCLVCRLLPVNILSLPCQHLVTCKGCAAAAITCPKCCLKIESKIPTFLA